MEESFAQFFENVLKSSTIVDSYLRDVKLNINPTSFKMANPVTNDQMRVRQGVLAREVIYPESGMVAAFRETVGLLSIDFTGSTYFGNSDLGNLLSKAVDSESSCGIRMKFTITEKDPDKNQYSSNILYEMTHAVGDECPVRRGDEDFILAAHKELGDGRRN
jgi:hypothetical protein